MRRFEEVHSLALKHKSKHKRQEMTASLTGMSHTALVNQNTNKNTKHTCRLTGWRLVPRMQGGWDHALISHEWRAPLRPRQRRHRQVEP